MSDVDCALCQISPAFHVRTTLSTFNSDPVANEIVVGIGQLKSITITLPRIAHFGPWSCSRCAVRITRPGECITATTLGSARGRKTKPSTRSYK